MTTKEQVLQNCTIEGNIVKLPNIQLDRKLYQEVAKSLELIGGKVVKFLVLYLQQTQQSY